jgi:hypothetical protein
MGLRTVDTGSTVRAMFNDAPNTLSPEAQSRTSAPVPMGGQVGDVLRRREWGGEVEIETALGRAIWAERGRAKGQVLHWTCGRQLLAVVDTGSGEAAYRPKVRREEVERAHIVVRPEGASFIPEDFRRSTVYDLLWQFGHHAQDALEHLPTRLYEQELVLGKSGQVSRELMTLQHAAIIDALEREPLKLAQLSELLGAPKSQLARAIAPLYLARSISTRPPGVLKRSVMRVRHLLARKR